ncbi:MAG: GNAT family N-acetyltransferase [Acidimicrobiia bacterium]|nr:GNAT family N-acetyltransferase [Acidimicrobiia bacterium]
MRKVSAVEFNLRVLTASTGDREVGQQLVREYVEHTAREMTEPGGAPDLEAILPYIPDYHDFAAKYHAPGALFLVAERDGVACGGVGVARYEGTTCEMNRLWVRPEHQGHGAGRALVAESLSHARTRGYERMVLDVLTSRTGPIALYRSLGFADCESIHEYTFEVVPLALDL